MARIVYRIVSHHAGGYAVEIGPRKDIQRVRSGFQTQDQAKAWVAEQATAAKGTDQWVRQFDLPQGANGQRAP
jgi:hypothetical protein